MFHHSVPGSYSESIFSRSNISLPVITVNCTHSSSFFHLNTHTQQQAFLLEAICHGTNTSLSHAEQRFYGDEMGQIPKSQMQDQTVQIQREIWTDIFTSEDSGISHKPQSLLSHWKRPLPGSTCADISPVSDHITAALVTSVHPTERDRFHAPETKLTIHKGLQQIETISISSSVFLVFKWSSYAR